MPDNPSGKGEELPVADLPHVHGVDQGCDNVCVEEANGATRAHEPPPKPWHCAKCGKPMQFFDGICFACNGGKDPGD